MLTVVLNANQEPTTPLQLQPQPDNMAVRSDSSPINFGRGAYDTTGVPKPPPPKPPR